MFESMSESEKTSLLMMSAALVLVSTLGGLWAGFGAFGGEGSWLSFIGILFVVFYALIGLIVLRIHSQSTVNEEAKRFRANMKDIREQARNSKHRREE